MTGLLIAIVVLLSLSWLTQLSQLDAAKKLLELAMNGRR